jgi:hypothetical protein
VAYPQATITQPDKPDADLGPALALGAGVAACGAFIVGVFSGVTGIQSTYVAVLLGWLVGLVVSRAGRDLPAAAGAAILSLAGSVAASVIAVTISLIRHVHVPLTIVLEHISRVLSVVPHVVGFFGFWCWALASVVGWATVKSRGRARRSAPWPATSYGAHGVPAHPPDAGGIAGYGSTDSPAPGGSAEPGPGTGPT